MKKYKKFDNKIFLYPIAFFLIIYGYRGMNSNENKNHQIIQNTNKSILENQNNELDETQKIVKLKDGYHFYAVTKNNEIDNIIKIITRDCKGNEVCEVEKEFQYVSNKPYTISDKDRTPNEVINKNGGDCDEKAYLFASMLKATNHKCVIVYTKQHTFVAVNIKKIADLYSNTTSLKINNEYYFYAETTAKDSYIGWFNGMSKDKIETIYDVNENREIPIEEIDFLQV